MPDDKRDFTPPRAEQIVIADFISRLHWAHRLGVSQDRLRAVVMEVGPLVDDVTTRLGSDCLPVQRDGLLMESRSCSDFN